MNENALWPNSRLKSIHQSECGVFMFVLPYYYHYFCCCSYFSFFVLFPLDLEAIYILSVRLIFV